MSTSKRKADGEKGRKKKKAQVSESSSSDSSSSSSSSSSSDSEDEFSALGLAPEQLVKVRRLSATIDRCKDAGKQAAMQARLVKFLSSVAGQQHRQEAALKPPKPVATLVTKPAAFSFSAGGGSGAITLTPQEVERRKQRMQRFEASEAEAAGPGSQHRQVLHDVSDGLGSCETLEKEYLRLTSLPRATDVRPPRVLQAALKLVKARWRENADYKYACEQLKSIRQDLTVQHIRDSLAVDAYETHARIALEMRDLAEFNQCHAVLKTLYDEGATGNRDEFLAYGLLYALIACSFKGMGSGAARQALCSELMSLALSHTTSQRIHTSPAAAAPAGQSTSLPQGQPHLDSVSPTAEPSSSSGAQGSGKKRRKATQHTQPGCKRTGDVAAECSGPKSMATQPSEGHSVSHRGTDAAASTGSRDAGASEQGNGHVGDTGAAALNGRGDVLREACVSHACAVVGAFRLGDWVRFISLYGSAPRMIPYLMDHMLPAVRAYALQSLITAHRPLPLPTSAVLLALGFDTHEDTISFCTQHGAALVEGGAQIDTRASGATKQ